MAKIHDEASHVESAPHEVMIDGPDGVAVSMTPEAAATTGAKLLDKAAEARGEGLIADALQQAAAAREAPHSHANAHD